MSESNQPDNSDAFRRALQQPLPANHDVVSRALAKAREDEESINWDSLRSLRDGSVGEALRGLGEVFRYHLAQILPPPTPGAGVRGKRLERSADQQFIFELTALTALGVERTRDLANVMESAVRRHDTETLGTIREAVEAIKNANASKTKFSQHVVAALYYKRSLQSSLGRLPTKGEVKRAVIDQLKSAERAQIKDDKLPYFAEQEDARWREVFEAAQLKDLPQERGKRGPSRHGG